VTVNFDTSVEVWFGEMDEGTFKYAGSDPEDTMIVHLIHERRYFGIGDTLMDQIHEYMDRNGHLDFVIPTQYRGRIVFSNYFFKRMVP
jgi:hypothetical protein